jgi:transcriptional/translational regulatory protein YebC/TACO1
LEEVFEDEDGILIYAFFKFWNHPKELENRNLEILSSDLNEFRKYQEAEMADVEKLIEKLEEDDDVMNVYHTMEA